MFWLKKLKRIFNRATWIHIFYFHVPSPWASELLHLIRFPVFRNMHGVICSKWPWNVWVDGKFKRTHPVIVPQSLILKFCYIGNAVATDNTSNFVLLGFSFHLPLLTKPSNILVWWWKWVIRKAKLLAHFCLLSLGCDLPVFQKSFCISGNIFSIWWESIFLLISLEVLKHNMSIFKKWIRLKNN